MHLCSCEHPRIIKQRFTHQLVSVPCGECNTCLNNKAMSWIVRLEQERLNKRYSVFFTLTYADKYLPLLEIGWNKSSFLPDLLVHKKRDFSDLENKNKKCITDENNDFKVPFSDSDLSESVTQNIMHLHAGNIPYVSKIDIQNFIKRLRSKCYRSAYGTDKNLSEEQKISYFVATEYGPTSLRPHAHGTAYFDDPRLAEVFGRCLSEAWPFGNITYEYIQNSASSYVAKYINSISYLPGIYKSPYLRPFHLSSRSTPIGLCAIEESTIKEILDTSSNLMPIKDSASQGVAYVPLWRTLENRLFPKLPRDSSLTPDARSRILFAFTRFTLSTFQEFCEDLAMNICKSCDHKHVTQLQYYLDFIVPFWSLNKDYAALYSLFINDNSIKRCYYVARRVVILCYRYGYNTHDYFVRYMDFWKNKELYNLKIQYEFEEDFVKHYPLDFLLNIDPIFYNNLVTINFDMISSVQLVQLESFGLLYSKLKTIYQNAENKKSYFDSYHFSRSIDFIDMQSINFKIATDARKKKKKNEYLKLHPEYAALY